jgi:putative membrane protein
VVPCEQAFAVIGDEAVHAKCGQEFWEQTAKAVEADFAAGHFTEGLVRGICRAGELLAEHFPKAPSDRNELPDEIARD